MLDATLVTAQQIKLKQKAIARYLAALTANELNSETLLGIYTVLGSASDYDDFKTGLATDLGTKNTDLDADFAAL